MHACADAMLACPITDRSLHNEGRQGLCWRRAGSCFEGSQLGRFQPSFTSCIRQMVLSTRAKAAAPLFRVLLSFATGGR